MPGPCGDRRSAERTLARVLQRHGHVSQASRTERLQLLFRQVPAAIWATDRELRFTDVEGRAPELTGELSNARPGATLQDWLGTADPAEPSLAHHLDALDGRSSSFRYERSGHTYEVGIEPLRDAAGDIVGTIGAGVDVTELRRNEEELARSRSKLEQAQNISHVGWWEWDARHDRVSWSDELHRIYGLYPGEFEGTVDAFFARIHPDDMAETRRVVSEAFSSTKPFVHDHRIVRPDGEVRMLHTRGQTIADERGKPSQMVGTCWDVTDRWEAQKKIERAASLMRAVVESTADGILVVDRQGKVTAFNRRFLAMWKLVPEAAAEADDATLIRAAVRELVDPGGFLARVNQLYAQPEADSFDVLRFKDGRVIERYSTPQRLGADVVGRVWSFRDVTSRDRALAEAREALHAREEFLSVAAHEIRGPLTSIHLAVQGLRCKALSAAAERRMFEVIEREDRRLARLVDDLLDVGIIRKGRLQLELGPVDLVEVVRDAVARVESVRTPSDSTISVAVPPQVIGRWDRSRLEQVVSNLLTNAIKFGEGKPVRVELIARPGWATLKVRDEGIGISPDEQQRIFEPFERAVVPRHYGGFGLGLYIVRTIVEGLGGGIRVQSAPGQGATFAIDLPLEKSP